MNEFAQTPTPFKPREHSFIDVLMVGGQVFDFLLSFASCDCELSRDVDVCGVI